MGERERDPDEPVPDEADAASGELDEADLEKVSGGTPETWDPRGEFASGGIL